MDLGGQCHTLAALPLAKRLLPTAQEAGWALGPVCLGMKTLALLGFQPWTVQLMDSRYTNCTVLAARIIAMMCW
jgi:hypothetical protein